MSYELEFYDLWYDNGYGGIDGYLIVEVEPIFEDATFDAYNQAGVLQTYGNRRALSDVEVIGATFFAVDHDGGNIGEREFTDIDDLVQHFGITKFELTSQLSKIVD